jgi:hypothetical protein
MDLRVHGAGVVSRDPSRNLYVTLLWMMVFGSGTQILVRVRTKALKAVRAAEVVGLALVFMGPGGCFRLDGHAANGVRLDQRGFTLYPLAGLKGSMGMMFGTHK